MNHQNIFVAVLAASVISFSSCAGQPGRAKYETPNYEAVMTDAGFEVRDYPAVMVASVSMKAERNSAFMKLFGYISGKNEKRQKIEMTTPVFGVLDDGQSAMSFVVPKEVVKSGVPKPDNPNIVVAERPAGRFAVYRYNGRWTPKLEEAAREKLAKWAKKQGLVTIGGYEKANYDPPFTPPSMRRNEVLVRVRK